MNHESVLTGNCGWVDNFGMVCDAPASPHLVITLNDRLVKGQVIVCHKHHATYNRLAAELRTNNRSSKRGKRSV